MGIFGGKTGQKWHFSRKNVQKMVKTGKFQGKNNGKKWTKRARFQGKNGKKWHFGVK